MNKSRFSTSSSLFRAMALVAAIFGVAFDSFGQDARFFRVTGAVPTKIIGVSQTGVITWTNAPTNTIFTVQIANTLLGNSNWMDYVQIPASNQLTSSRIFDLNPPAGTVLIPAGSFVMGDTLDGLGPALPLHRVYISGFYMDKTEVTKGLWDDVYNWAIDHGYSFEFPAAGKTTNHPAENMAWYDAVKWCNARSEKEGLTPAYYTDAAQTNVYRSGVLSPQNDWVKWSAGYRLPTEAEWEKAARGGASGQRFPWTDTNVITHSRANYFVYQRNGTNYYVYDQSPTRYYHPAFAVGVYPLTSPVGYFAPNGYGLYDMAGNVYEWCWDWHNPSWYGNPAASSNDTRGPTSSGIYGHSMRGGAWYDDAYYTRCAVRGNGPSQDSHYTGTGFRCVRGL